MKKDVIETINGMQLIVTTVQELSLARDLETVMKIVRRVARQLTGADGSTFILREGNLCYYADEDAISPLWKGHRFPMETCISGWAMLNKQSTAIEDIYTDDRIPIDAYKPTFVKSLAMVPIRTIDPIGAIGNYWADTHLATEEELNLLQSLADITAVTLENVKVYNELETRVKERTAELQMLNKELESFSYSVSHDLRAPLRAITGYTNMLVEDYADKLGEDGKHLTDKINGGVVQMTSLINALLDFSRSGRKELVKVNVSIKDMVDEICHTILDEHRGKSIEFKISDLPNVFADYVLIKQVWTNLISNAVKYSSHREKSIIEIGVKKLEDKEVYYIKDNGVGFDMQYYNKLFGVFQRLHSQAEFEGTGVGLALVEKIISKHGGKIWAEAKVNEGAVFYFWLNN